MRSLTALPVYNEASSVAAVLREVRRFSQDVLVVDDGSTDGTSDLIDKLQDDQLRVVRHPQNCGYGAALRTAFEYSLAENYEIVVTVDCDGQHEPKRIPQFVEACRDVDVISGSRYLQPPPPGQQPPPDRRRVNVAVTGELNRRLGLQLTDAFCGFKAYRVAALAQLTLSEEGYAMPLELWVQAAFAGLRIRELPVPLIYLDPERTFGGALDDAEARLRYYERVLDASVAAAIPQFRECALLHCGEGVA